MYSSISWLFTWMPQHDAQPIVALTAKLARCPSLPLALNRLYLDPFPLFFPTGLLIDFGLAEPAEKWKARSEALEKHRDKRARRKQSQGKMSHGAGPEARSQRRASGDPSKDPEPRHPVAGREGNEGKFSTEESREALPVRDGEGNGHGKEDRLKLLRKIERGGTTGFRAPEILWHSRDQVREGEVKTSCSPSHAKCFAQLSGPLSTVASRNFRGEIIGGIFVYVCCAAGLPAVSTIALDPVGHALLYPLGIIVDLSLLKGFNSVCPASESCARPPL